MDPMSMTVAVSVLVFAAVYALRKLPFFSGLWAALPDDVRVFVPGVVSAVVMGFEAFYSGRSAKEAATMALSAAALAVFAHHGAKFTPFLPYGNKPKA
jgi:hypothetical protein